MAAAKSRGKPYTRIQSEFLEAGYQDLTLTQLFKAFNNRFHYAPRTYAAIRSFLRNRFITCGGQGHKDNWQCSLMTRKQSDWLKENYVNISVKEITQQFNQRYAREVTGSQMKAFIATRGFKSGNTGYFPKGSVPANKGCKHRPGYAPGRMAEGQFKAGPRLNMRLPIGHERVDKDGYVLVKVDMINPHTGIQGHYRHKHRMVWEAANGPIPDDHVLTFLDDNPGNPELGNLALITRSELCRRNKLQYRQAEPELRDSIKAIAKLQYTTALIQRQETG